MKERSEFYPFMSFFNEIKNQFGKIIKILKSDNAKEYFSAAFSTFLFFIFPRNFTSINKCKTQGI